MSKKNIKVELIRIIACFAVLVYHTRRLPILGDGSVSETAVFIECLCTLCVVTFFMLSGFFIYKRDNNILLDWGHVWISFLKTLCVPAFLVTIVCIIFNDYFVSKYSFSECIRNFDIKYVWDTFVDGLRTFSVNRWPNATAHLWYVFSYGLIVLYYPIVRCILRLDKRIVYAVLIILAALQLYDDILIYYDKWTFNLLFDYIPRPVIYSAWGHMLYNDILKNIKDEKLSNKIILNNKILIIGIIMYLVSFIGIFFMQYNYNAYVRGIHTYTAWYSIGALTMSMAMAMCVISINFDKIFNDKIKKVVLFVGGMTLGIYLLHYPIVVKLNTCLFQNYIQDKLSLNFVTQMIYVVFYNIFMFLLTGIVLLFVRLIKNLFLIAIHKRKFVK